MLRFQRRLAHFGCFNALAQLFLKLTAPGVPDIYQGSELWAYSLVDPDNRRPVDYARPRALLAELKTRVQQAGADLTDLARQLLETSADGRIKLYVTWRTLNFRRAHPHLFLRGSYEPLQASGPKQEHVCAFARRIPEEAIVVAVPRMLVRLTDGAERLPLGAEVWQHTWLTVPQDKEPRRYRNLFTGEVLTASAEYNTPGLMLAHVFRSFPVALLERMPA
jgi:(1->4)-alpha-D-glucan 1-alpha-D-glucosylmutase